MDKISIIVSAAEAGIFRKRTPETRREKALELLEAGETFGQIEPGELVAVIEEEAERQRKEKLQRAEAKARKLAEKAARPLVAGGVPQVAKATGGRFVVTVAQNNTEIHKGFFASLQNFARHMGAEILVCKTAYNKHGFCQPEKDKGLYYSADIPAGFFFESDIMLAEDLMLLGSANVIPTARNPAKGYENATPPGVSVIVPAVKIGLEVCAALKGAQVKTLYSTGAITLPNYVQRKAGQTSQGEFCVGALYVEKVGESWKAYQLQAMDETGEFFHFHEQFTAFGVFEASNSIAALQFGDIHAEKMSAEQLRECENLAAVLKPRTILIHDVADFSSRNHHNRKDRFFVMEQDKAGKSVKGDLQQVAKVLQRFSAYAEVIAVESNHDLALARWMVEEADRWAHDSINAETYLMLALAQVQGKVKGNLLEYALINLCGLTEEQFSIQFHETDQSIVIAGIEHGNHGHNGINGAKGSPQGFRKLGVRMNTGHTHSPSIHGGVYTAGVAAGLDMGYNRGPSSWVRAHILTYVNGQRQIIYM